MYGKTVINIIFPKVFIMWQTRLLLTEPIRLEMQMPLIPTVIIFTLLVYFYVLNAALLTFDDSVFIKQLPKSLAIISCEYAARHVANVVVFYLFTQ